MILPAEAQPLLDAFSSVFTQPTFHRFVILLGSAIFINGRRTVANLLRTAAPLTEAHATTYQRVFSAVTAVGRSRKSVLVLRASV